MNGNPANIYLFKVNNRNIRKTGKICQKLTAVNFFIKFQTVAFQKLLTFNIIHTFL